MTFPMAIEMRLLPCFVVYHEDGNEKNCKPVGDLARNKPKFATKILEQLQGPNCNVKHDTLTSAQIAETMKILKNGLESVHRQVAPMRKKSAQRHPQAKNSKACLQFQGEEAQGEEDQGEEDKAPSNTVQHFFEMVYR